MQDDEVCQCRQPGYSCWLLCLCSDKETEFITNRNKHDLIGVRRGSATAKPVEKNVNTLNITTTAVRVILNSFESVLKNMLIGRVVEHC